MTAGAGTLGQRIQREVEEGVVQKELWKLLKLSGPPLSESTPDHRPRAVRSEPTRDSSPLPQSNPSEAGAVRRVTRGFEGAGPGSDMCCRVSARGGCEADGRELSRRFAGH